MCIFSKSDQPHECSIFKALSTNQDCRRVQISDRNKALTRLLSPSKTVILFVVGLYLLFELWVLELISCLMYFALFAGVLCLYMFVLVFVLLCMTLCQL